MVLVGPWGLFWNSRVLERLNIRFLKPFFIISLSYWFSGRGHFAPRGNLVVFGSDSFGGEEEYITKGALGDKLEDQRFSPSTTDPPFLCIILCQLQVKTVWDLACGPHYAHPPSHPTLPIARVPSCSVKAFCFAAMLPSNLCICPSISLAASVKVTGILLELLPIGTSQKEVTVTRFLLSQFLKALTPIRALSIGEICGFICSWILWWLGNSPCWWILPSFLWNSVMYSGLEYMIIDKWPFRNEISAFADGSGFVSWAASSAAVSWPLCCPGRGLTKGLPAR